jgi:hypothetical protein
MASSSATTAILPNLEDAKSLPKTRERKRTKERGVGSEEARILLL